MRAYHRAARPSTGCAADGCRGESADDAVSMGVSVRQLATQLPPPSAALAIVAGAVLAWHASAGPHLYDAGGLVAAASDLAGSHPPGQPLHAIVAHALARFFPFGPFPWRVALASAIGEATAAFVAGRICALLLTQTPTRPWMREAAAVATAFAVLVAPPMLRQSMRPEVYGLAAALTLASIHQLLAWSFGERAALRRAALLAGLAAAVHPPHALAAILAGVAVVIVARRDVVRDRRALAITAVVFVVGLAPYLLLPVRGAAGVLQWGDATTLGDLIAYVTGAPYHANLGAGTHGLLANAFDVAVYGAWAAGLLPLAGVPLAAHRVPGEPDSGVWARRAAVLAIPLVAIAAMLQPLDTRVPDHVAYVGPAVALLVATSVAGVVRWRRRIARPALGALIALNIPALASVPDTIGADSPALETLAGVAVEAPPSRALVLVSSDLVTLSWRMARAVEDARPDVALLPVGTIREPWQWRPLASHPAFDGTPAEAEGSTPRDRLVAGAIGESNGRVAVVSEKAFESLPPSTIVGMYFVSDEDAPSSHVAEEWTSHALAEIAHAPEGDGGALGAALRNVMLNRARRLMAAGHPDEALAIHAALVGSLPGGARATLDVPDRIAILPRSAPPTVHDPEALFLASPEDAVREAAVALWQVGLGEQAGDLLEAQLARGDARALLQHGWLLLSSGDLPGARRALDRFMAIAPELRPEAGLLRRALGG